MFGRSCLAFWVSFLCLGMSGCNSSNRNGFAGPLPQTKQSVQKPRGSWIKPGVSAGDLLYVSDWRNNVLVFSYPQGILVSNLTDVAFPLGQCSDGQGNVFIIDDVSSSGGRLVEYAHGGTSPINVLTFQYRPTGCSVDPTTGNLAVTDVAAQVNLFQGEQGQPTIYQDGSATKAFLGASYDDSGDLFIASENHNNTVLTKFKAGTFTEITINQNVRLSSAIAWDGSDVVIGDFLRRLPKIAYQVKISGSNGTVVGTVSLGGHPADTQMWIGGNTLLTPIWLRPKHRIRPDAKGEPRNVAFFAYPKGGKAIMTLPPQDFNRKGFILGLTVSVAPSRK